MTKQEKIIELFVENEISLNDLYSFFAERFPEKNAFWKKIASEELEHAQWIRELGDKVVKEEVNFNEDRFNPGVLKIFAEYIEEEKQYIIKNNSGPTQTLSIAINIEREMLERKFFEIFESDSAEIKILLKRLEEATKVHMKHIEDELSKSKE